MRRLSFWQVAKIGVSMLLIGLLLYKSDPLRLVDVLRRVKVFYVAVAFVASLVGLGLNGYRLKVLLSAQGVSIPLPHLLSSHLVGFFFSAFLPGSTGGDVSRAYDLVKLSGDNPGAVSSVILWRATGLTTLILISLVASLLGFNMIRDTSLIGIILALLATVIFLWWAFFNQMLMKRLCFLYAPLVSLLRATGLEKPVLEAYRGLVLCRGQRTVLLTNLGLATFCQVFVILTWYVMSLALGLQVPLFYFFVFVPIIGVLKAIPISVNGLGIREGLAVFLFGLVGVSSPAALSLSLLLFGTGLVVSLMGGGIYLVRSLLAHHVRSERYSGSMSEPKPDLRSD